jgi:hypothetical protein
MSSHNLFVLKKIMDEIEENKKKVMLLFWCSIGSGFNEETFTATYDT